MAVPKRRTSRANTRHRRAGSLLWLATRPAVIGLWSQAGPHGHCDPAGVSGDWREPVAGEDGWRTLPDPFPAWQWEDAHGHPQ
ncbi:50S ribosomal protein L32 [Actinoplanes sp. NBC_00393]|uniref:50S ribosomal protein L32 n=1 Tax=Actinoplanes sp. NBC_00393 TaxID=2975953 RepID=UPI003FA4C309